MFYIYGGLTLAALAAGVIWGVRFFAVTHREGDLKACIILFLAVLFLGYSTIRSRSVPFATEGQKDGRTDGEQGMEEAVGSGEEAGELYTSKQEAGETIILEQAGAFQAPVWKLKSRNGETEDIRLTVLPGVLGRKTGEVDYILTGEGVSRRHAMVFQCGDSLYIEDLASTNGTYLNGERLKEGEPRKLEEGDTISIGYNRYQVGMSETFR